MKRVMTIMLALAVTVGVSAKTKTAVVPQLKFDASKGEARVMTMPDGAEVRYTAYEGMQFVTNVEDSAYQTINVYVPQGATQQTPIFLRTYVGGYMASKAKQPSAGDATGRALKEGYVVAIPGSRGRNSTIIATKADKRKGIKKGQTIFTGRAPAAILDLKVAVRYLRQFDKEMLGDAGADIPDSIGFVVNKEDMGGMPPINGGMTGGMRPMMRGGRGGNRAGEYIVDLDMAKYLNYVVSTQPLKTAPAFDTKGVAGQSASGENEEFGDSNGSSVNFTAYGCEKNGINLDDATRENARLLNPMCFIGDEKTDVAPHWYIRHGARDRDTSFPVPLNLALKLQNTGKDVNYLLAWNRPHSGDYALDELFQWIRDIME